MNRKTVRNSLGTFTLVRSESSQEFVCERCLAPKIAKLKVQWVDTSRRAKTICNGCYGRVVSDLK